jgi:serine/threonine protein kinase/tetratricopeptide (TPR) repeat protein
MSVERPANKPALRDLFVRALELQSEPERDAYLQDIRRKHPDLYPKLMALVRNEKDDSFLEGPAAEALETLVGPAPLAEAPGCVIGKYKLLERLGEGGFGVVYKAEQKEPVKRRVALKIIKVGMDTREVVARFEAERQALAIMDHPNIAKVHDGGATETGRPYFVMELVRGVKITDYCDEKKLSTRERLDLFTQVCHAVQHAHQKGIIHRDLKPSNILVTVNDGVPAPKIIDFGIAKATQMELTEKTVFTRFHQFIGTPAYLSPEQAEITSVDIDTRSDIYSLGVLLYELLTGKTPFDGKELLKVGLDEMRRTIREKEPERPSTRVSTFGADELTTTAKRRGLEPPKLANALRGDLDWIVMKCLEKDRARRYETANGLAMDIQRHLSNEPVVACPPSAAYRFQKLVRRNKVAFAASFSIAAALVLGLCVATWGLVRERQARKEQARLRHLAEAREIKTEQVSKFLKAMLQGAGPEVAKGRDATVLVEVLDQTTERISRELADQPEVETDLRKVMGEIYMELGQYEKAEKVLRRAVEINRTSHPEGDGALSFYLNDLSVYLSLEHKLPEAEATLREALQMQSRLFGSNDPHVGQGLVNLATLQCHQGKLAEAESTYHRALELMKKPWGSENPYVPLCLANLGRLLLEEGQLTQAENTMREALALSRKVHGEQHTLVADALDGLAECLKAQDKFDLAEAAAREALAMREKLLGPDHPVVGTSINSVAGILNCEGRLDEAEALDRRALGIARKALGEQNPNVATSLNNLALVLEYQGKYEEAEPLLREALDRRRKCLGPEPLEIAKSLHNLACLLTDEDKLPEAKSLFTEALAMNRKLLGNQHPTVATTLGRLADVLRKLGQLDEAETNILEALSIERKVWSGDHLGLAGPMSCLGRLRADQGRYSEAEIALTNAVAIEKRICGPDCGLAADTLRDLRAVFLKEGKLDEAEKAAREDLRIRMRLNKPGVDDSLHLLAIVLQKEGKLGEAEEQYRAALELRGKVSARSTAYTLNDLADLFGEQGRLGEAEALYRQTIEFQEKIPDHQRAYALNNLAGTVSKQNRLAEAEDLARRALALAMKSSPPTNHLAAILSNLASILTHERKFDEAEEAYTSALRSGPGNPTGEAMLLERRGGLSAQRGQWENAERDLARALQTGPADDLEYWTWYQLAAVLAQEAKTEAYQDHCHKCLLRFSRLRDPERASWISRACLILPSAGPDLEAAGRLADLAVVQAGTNSPGWTKSAATKALAEYRQGNFTNALEWAQRASHRADFQTWGNLEVETHAVLAMTHSRLNQDDLAAQELALAGEIALAKLPKLESGDLGGGPFSWIVAHALLQEAQTVVERQAMNGVVQRPNSKPSNGAETVNSNHQPKSE